MPLNQIHIYFCATREKPCDRPLGMITECNQWSSQTERASAEAQRLNARSPTGQRGGQKQLDRYVQLPEGPRRRPGTSRQRHGAGSESCSGTLLVLEGSAFNHLGTHLFHGEPFNPWSFEALRSRRVRTFIGQTGRSSRRRHRRGQLGGTCPRIGNRGELGASNRLRRQ
jgi:hypothetical protein